MRRLLNLSLWVSILFTSCSRPDSVPVSGSNNSPVMVPSKSEPELTAEDLAGSPLLPEEATHSRFRGEYTCGHRYNYEKKRSSLGYAGLLKIIKQNKVASIDELLPRLPKSYRANFTLMHRSHSEQFASLEQPRVILFGEDASLIIAYSTHPNEKGFDSLETIEFDRTKRQFVFRSIEFPSPTNGLIHPTGGEKNPDTCLHCHHQSPRPNWEGYRNNQSWADSFFGGGAREQDFKNLFLKEKISPRLAVLEGRDRLNQPLTFTTEPPSSPSGLFNVLIDDLNQIRLANVLRTDPDFSKFKYALIGALANCEHPDQFVPSELRAKTSYPAILKEVEKEMLEGNGDEDYRESLRRSAGFRFANVKYLMSSLGRSTDDWSLNPQRPHEFSSGDGFGIAALWCHFPEVAKVRNEMMSVPLEITLRDPAETYRESIRDWHANKASFCSELKEKSLQAFR